MVDVTLVVTSVIFAVLVAIGAFYFVIYFQDPSDKWVAWYPKVVVVILMLNLGTCIESGCMECVSFAT